MEGWLEQSDLHDTWVEVIDGGGTTLGWIERRRADMLGLRTQLIEVPDRYLSDPYVRYHAQLAFERGLLTRGRDLNDVQIALLGSQIIKRNEVDEKLRVRRFEEDMLVNNPDLFKAYRDKKEREHEVNATGGVQEKVPSSVEEFLAALAAFDADEGVDSGKEQESRAEGWLSGLLSEEDLDQMSDD